MGPLWLFPLMFGSHWTIDLLVPIVSILLSLTFDHVEPIWTQSRTQSLLLLTRSMLRRKKLAERDQYYWVGACVDQYLLKNSSNIVDCWMFTHTLQLNITEHHYTMLDVAQWYFRSVWPGLNACPTSRLFSQFMWNFLLHDLVQRISHSNIKYSAPLNYFNGKCGKCLNPGVSVIYLAWLFGWG